MATKNNPGKFDCYENAAPDEPMFVLLGRDKHAAALVELWALMRAADGEDPEKLAEALTCALHMRGYCIDQGKTPVETYHAVVTGIGHMAGCIENFTRAKSAEVSQPKPAAE